jgi:N-methylhydantoinase A
MSRLNGSYRLGIDVGGTFTDLILYDQNTGEVYVHKVPSTPETPSQSVVNGVDEIVQKAGISPESINYFIHGTTLGVNAVIQRKGAKTGLIVSKGFKDILEIGRLRMLDPFALIPVKRSPLVERANVKTVQERVSPSGEVEEHVSESEVRQLVQELVNDGVRCGAICLLNSYVNPANEEKVERIVAEEFPQLYLSVSSELWPELREYERCLVTTIDVYVKPLMDRYLTAIHRELEDLGLITRLYITKSNGGMMTAASARRAPIETLLSGPASGVMGASHIAQLAGISRAISIDMGGTSADISILREGRPSYSTEDTVGDFPLIMPAVEVWSIGAGGGSIAWVDQSGVLKVGPESAGADPGPACYGQGGTEPTITDAYLICGYLNPDNFLGGRIKLHRELAEKAMAKIAEKLGMDVFTAAESILRVATSTMYLKFFSLMARRGIDPREHALVAFGGAGPTHACLLSEEVGIDTVIIPPTPGLLCALGALISDVRRDSIKTINSELAKVSTGELQAHYAELERHLVSWLRDEGPIVEETYLERSADMRYKGQAYEIEVMLSDSTLHDHPPQLENLFHRNHEEIHGHSDPKAAVELINLRARIIGRTPKVSLTTLPKARKPIRPYTIRPIFYQGRQYEADVYHRRDLKQGHLVKGPAIIEQEDTTTFIPPAYAGRTDQYGIVTVSKSI